MTQHQLSADPGRTGDEPVGVPVKKPPARGGIAFADLVADLPGTEAPKAQKRPSARGGIAFSDLVADLPGLPEESQDEARPEPKPSGRSKYAQGADLDRLNARVLGASGYQTKPQWVRCLVFGAVSLILLRSANLIGAYSITLPAVTALGGFTCLYSLHGLWRGKGRKERVLCGVAFAMGLLTVWFALL